MKNDTRHRTSLWRKWVFLLGLLIFVLPTGSAALAAPTPPASPQALVRVDLVNRAQLEGLAAAGTSIYAQVYTPNGAVYLLMPADARLQADLMSQGYRPQVLDADVAGARYYLLYGQPEGLRQAGDSVTILSVEGQQAVARLPEDQEPSLPGMRALPLVLHPLALPRDEQVTDLPQSITPLPIVQGMIDQVKTTNLYDRVGDLSGEWPVFVGGESFTFKTRYTYADTSIKQATRYVYDFFASQGLAVYYDTYNLSGNQKRSVIAQQTGLTQPERIFLLTAHVDSLSSQAYTNAPGADDNASGVVAMMTIAEILSRYDFGCTLRYAAFSGEEQGLYGSRAYATEVQAAGDDIEAVLNMDMLAYNTPGSPATFDLHTRPGNPGDLAIANAFADAVTAYALDLQPQIRQDGLTSSDHSPFWEHGYSAILAIEDWSNHTPNYHTVNDKLGTLDMAYYTAATKAALATFAHMGCLLDGQVSGVITDASTSQAIPGAHVLASVGSSHIRQAVAKTNGAYLLPLQTGTYDLSFSSVNYKSEVVSGVAITQGQIVTQNLAMQPCGTISGTTFNLSTPWPALGETITFTATVSGGDAPITYTWNFGDGASANGAVVTHAFAAPGSRLVELKADNACSLPEMVVRDLFVKVGLFFLPTIFK